MCFMDDFRDNCAQALTHEKEIFVVDVLNCKMMRSSPKSDAQKDLCLSLNLTQLITSAARETPQSSSNIDVIMTSNNASIGEFYKVFSKRTSFMCAWQENWWVPAERTRAATSHAVISRALKLFLVSSLKSIHVTALQIFTSGRYSFMQLVHDTSPRDRSLFIRLWEGPEDFSCVTVKFAWEILLPAIFFWRFWYEADTIVVNTICVWKHLWLLKHLS